MFHTGGNGTESDKQEVRFTTDFIGSNALFKVVEIRGVEPLTFSMPLSVNNIEISTNYASFRTLVALCIYFLYTKPR